MTADRCGFEGCEWPLSPSLHCQMKHKNPAKTCRARVRHPFQPSKSSAEVHPEAEVGPPLTRPGEAKANDPIPLLAFLPGVRE